MKRLLTELGAINPDQAVPINCGDQGALELIQSGIAKAKTKHIVRGQSRTQAIRGWPAVAPNNIDIKRFHAYDEQKRGNIQFSYIESEDNLADIFTKALPRPRHQTSTNKLNLGT